MTAVRAALTGPVEPHDSLLLLLDRVDGLLKTYRHRGFATGEEVVNLLLDVREAIPSNPAPAPSPEPITHEEWLTLPSDVRGVVSAIVFQADLVGENWPPLIHPLAVRAVAEYEE